MDSQALKTAQKEKVNSAFSIELPTEDKQGSVPTLELFEAALG